MKEIVRGLAFLLLAFPALACILIAAWCVFGGGFAIVSALTTDVHGSALPQGVAIAMFGVAVGLIGFGIASMANSIRDSE